MASKINSLEGIKKLLSEKDLSSSLSKILKTEKKDLSRIKLIQEAITDNKIIDKLKTENDISQKKEVKLFVYSKIMSMLAFYNKLPVLDEFLASLSEKELKKVATYEYKNKTDITNNNTTFDKYCLKYKINFLSFPNKDEILELTQKIDVYNEILKKEGKAPRKNKNIFMRALITLFIVLFMTSLSFVIYRYVKMNNKYKNLMYPGIYVNEIDLSGKKYEDVKKLLEEEKNKILDKKIVFNNVNGDYEYVFKDLNVNLDIDKMYDEIVYYNNHLSFFEKLKILIGKSAIKKFSFIFTYNDDTINIFVGNLKNIVNKEVRNDGIIVDGEHNIHYDPGVNGFILDEDDTKEKLISLLSDYKNDKKIKLEGAVTNKEVTKEHLSSIDTKISSFSTWFEPYGNRGSNIILAAQRMNGSVVMPGDEFSYNKAVGPYTYGVGYRVSTAYVNGDVSEAIGGGVCQLASTLYNAELRAGLTTTQRKNHIFAANYVPYGLDATVYADSVDLKFKNELQYPIYISSYNVGSKLTVDIWSNSKAIEGKRFEPYAYYSNGGYHAYLKIFENDVLIETRYLNSSYYKTHD